MIERLKHFKVFIVAFLSVFVGNTVGYAKTPDQCVEYKNLASSVDEIEILLDSHLRREINRLHSLCHNTQGGLAHQIGQDQSLSVEIKELLTALALKLDGDLQYRLSFATGNLSEINFPFAAVATSSDEFIQALLSELGYEIEKLFGLTDEDSYYLEWQKSGELLESQALQTLLLHRLYKGIIYHENRIEIMFSEISDDVYALEAMVGHINASVPAGECPQPMQQNEIRALIEGIEGEFEIDSSIPIEDPRVRYYDGQAYWTQAVNVNSDSLGPLKAAILNISSKELLYIEEPAQYKTGSVGIPTNIPYEDFEAVGKTYYPAPLIDICDDIKIVSGITTCDENTFLDTTTYDGEFQVSDQSGNYWYVDFRGDHVYDISDVESAGCSPSIVSLIAPLIYSSNLDIPWFTSNCRGRRGEIYFHLNYARKFATTVGSYFSMPEPLDFFLEIDGTNNKCGGGFFSPSSDRLCIKCGSGAFSLSNLDNYGEIDTRDSVYHEYSHYLSHAVSGKNTWYCPAPYCYPESLEDGWAKYSATIMSQHEYIHGDILLNFKFPTDWLIGSRSAGVVGILLAFHNQVGYAAYRSILQSRVDQELTTVLVGSDSASCTTDANQDGYLTIDDCSELSYYYNLLYRDRSVWSYMNEHQVEISRAFHRHVVDANPDLSGVQDFPWSDDVSNLSQNGPFVPLEHMDNSNEINLIYGPDYPLLANILSNEASLSFDYVTDGWMNGDVDKFTIFARAGEHYTLETHNVNTDTIVRILDKNWSYVVAKCGNLGDSYCYDDDGGDGLASKLDFWPATTGFYRVYVSPYSTNDCGPNKTYQLKFAIHEDDVGDSIDSANPISLDSSPKYGYINGISDWDIYYFYLPSAGTVIYNICSDHYIKPEIRFYDSSGNYLSGSYYANELCGNRSVFFTFANPGLYYARIAWSDNAYQGEYEFKIYSSNRDLDYGNAFSIYSLNDAPYYVIATDIETPEDIDWYKFYAQQNEQWTISTFGADSVDTEIELRPDSSIGMAYGSDSILYDDNGGYGSQNSSRIVFTAPRAGWYQVGVSDVGQDDSGKYGILFLSSGISGYSAPQFPQ